MAKQGTDLHSSTFDQMVAYEVVRDGFLDTHVKRIRQVYGQHRDVMLAALAREFPPDLGVRWTRPRGGLFLWVTLPEGLDSKALLARAVEQHVAFVPGASFHPDGSGANTMRLNFSNASEAMIDEGIARLGRVVRAALGRPERAPALATR
jgi:2-aminoadipate transaminase